MITQQESEPGTPPGRGRGHSANQEPWTHLFVPLTLGGGCRWIITHLTHNSMVLFILSLYEFSQEVLAVGLLQDGVVVQEDRHEVVVIFHPV